ncbi:MAG: dihydrolipoyl dehydrogenase [Telmatospirillum sp.]|nr:dihydrolipoyl dehydrogenase [Telmatospirillum sp.]
MSNPLSTTVLVIGGGPAGYVAAVRAGQLGLDTTLVEAERLGGTCLLKGCIPSKALIHAAGQFAAMMRAAAGPHIGIHLAVPPTLDLAETMAWKDGIVDRLSSGVAGLLKGANVRVLAGRAEMLDGKTCRVATASGVQEVAATHVILATGSQPVSLPHLPFGGPVMSSTEALALTSLPRRLLVVGAGYIGLELGTAFRQLGSEVSVVEAASEILPLYDRSLTGPVRRWMEREGIALWTQSRATGLCPAGDGVAVTIERTDGSASRREEIVVDKVLVTVGRRPRTEGWGLENLALEMNGPFVRVDDQCRTSMRHVWAIGDLVGEPMLAHKGSAQGEMVAEIIAGHRRRFQPVAIPAVCFTQPEIVSVGLSPDEAKQQQIPVTVSQFPFSANGRALSMEAGEDHGFVRIVARADDHVILGVQAVGAHVAELSAAFVQALEMGALLEDISGMIHAHPTLSEAFPEATRKGIGMALHA